MEKFNPVKSFRNKLIFNAFFITGIITACIAGFYTFLRVVSSLSDDPDSDEFIRFISDTSNLINMSIIYLIIVAVILIPILILIPYYVNGIVYEVKDDEVIIHKGIINRTVKHIPYRTMTNVSSRYGVFDRLFGIGTVELETAGKSGQSNAPEGKIEGIRNYYEIRDIILKKLRQFKKPYTTTTELDIEEDVEVETVDRKFFKDLLAELKDIKDILKAK